MPPVAGKIVTKTTGSKNVSHCVCECVVCMPQIAGTVVTKTTGGKLVSRCVCFPDGEQIHGWHLLKENPTRLFVAWQVDR